MKAAERHRAGDAPMGVIFDMDGVLVDSYQAHFESWKRMAEAERLSAVTEPQFAATFGRTSRAILVELWGERFSDADVARLDARKEQLYRDLIRGRLPEMDGAGELIAALHRAGFRMAIGSSGPPENVRVVMDCLPKAGLISATVTGREVRHGKPDPEVFLLAAGKLDLPPGRCAVVEDAPAGVEAARRAGMAAIALTGTAPREKLAERAHLVVDSLRELTPALIRKLIEGRGRRTQPT